MEQTQKKFHLGTTDKFLMLGSVLGMLVFGFLLANESIITNLWLKSRATTEKVGEVGSSYNDVRRRLDRSLLWFAINEDESLFENDSIFTGADSETRLVLRNGLELTLESNSLVVLALDNDELFLDIQVGQVLAQVKKGKKVRLKQSDGRVTEVSGERPTAVTFSKNTSGTVEISTQIAPVKVKSEASEELVSPKEVLHIVPNQAKAEKKLMHYLLKVPAKSETLWLNDEDQLSFGWDALQPSTDNVLEISEQPNFSVVHASYPVGDETAARLENTLKDGEHYWRLRGSSVEDGAPVQSAVSSFSVYRKRPPELRYPPNGYTYLDQNKKIRFQWDAPRALSRFRLQVARDETFSGVIIDERVSANSFGPVDFKAGLYHWRVHSLDEGPLRGIWSERFEFKVGNPKPIQLTAPTPPEPVTPVAEVVPTPDVQNPVVAEKAGAVGDLTPPQAKLISPKSDILKFGDVKSRAPAAIEKSLKNPPVLKWDALPGAEQYQIQFARTDTFKKIIQDVKVTDSEYTWTAALPGKTFWRMRALGKDGAEGPFSEPQGTLYKLEPPQLSDAEKKVVAETPEEFDQPVKVEMDWPFIPYGGGFKLEVAKDKAFKNVVETLNVKESAATLAFNENGTYYVRGYTKSKSGRKISSVSGVKKVKIDRTLDIGLPKVNFPKNAMTIVSFGDSLDPILFNWTKAKNAKAYRIQYSSSPEFKDILLEHTTGDVSYLMGQKMPKGKTYWRMRAEYQDHHSDWTSTRYFVSQ